MSNPNLTAERVFSQSFLAECFSYDKDSGVILWNERPVNHFPSAGYCRHFNERFAGKPAGCVSRGYLEISVAGMGIKTRRIGAHRIIWCLVTGEWPTHLIDHKDLNGLNNKYDNLREATTGQNVSNCRVRKHNKTGLKGVSRTKNGKRFFAQLRGVRQSQLGVYDTAEEAYAAFVAAASRKYGEFFRG
jgi:hypothetical protein